MRKKEASWPDREERIESEKDRNEYKRKDGLRLRPRSTEYKRVQRGWATERDSHWGKEEGGE